MLFQTKMEHIGYRNVALWIPSKNKAKHFDKAKPKSARKRNAFAALRLCKSGNAPLKMQIHPDASNARRFRLPIINFDHIDHISGPIVNIGNKRYGGFVCPIFWESLILTTFLNYRGNLGSFLGPLTIFPAQSLILTYCYGGFVCPIIKYWPHFWTIGTI